MFPLLFGIAVLAAGAGAVKLHDSKTEYEIARATYQRVLAQSEAYSDQLQKLLESLGQCVFATQKELLRAHRILEPLNRNRPRFSLNPSESAAPLYSDALIALGNHEAALAALGGAGSGVLVAAGAWTAVGMLGTASTGTAIAGLHGVALSNATLAWLGGGALAQGGGGILAGKMILAKFIFLPAAFFMSIASFKKAADVDRATGSLRQINEENSESLATIKQTICDVTPLESRLISETEVLVDTLDRVSAELFPLGFLNRVWRWMRYRIRGCYYSSEEMKHVERVATAVKIFISNFKGNAEYESRDGSDSDLGSSLSLGR